MLDDTFGIDERLRILVVCMLWLLRIMGCLNRAHFDGTLVPGEEPSTASIRDNQRTGDEMATLRLHSVRTANR
jgi:hypothetical protein